MHLGKRTAQLGAVLGVVTLLWAVAAPALADYAESFDWHHGSQADPCIDSHWQNNVVPDIPYTERFTVEPVPNTDGWSAVPLGGTVTATVRTFDCDPPRSDTGAVISTNPFLTDGQIGAGVKYVEYTISGADARRRSPRERQGRFERSRSGCWSEFSPECRGLQVRFDIQMPGTTSITYRIVDLEGNSSAYQTVTVKLTSNTGVQTP